MVPSLFQHACLVEQHLVVLGEIGDAEELREAISVQVLETDQSVAAHVGRLHVPLDELVDFARLRFHHPHLAMGLDA